MLSMCPFSMRYMPYLRKVVYSSHNFLYQFSFHSFIYSYYSQIVVPSHFPTKLLYAVEEEETNAVSAEKIVNDLAVTNQTFRIKPFHQLGAEYIWLM